MKMLALADMMHGMERMWNAVHRRGQDDSWLTWRQVSANVGINIGNNNRTY